MSEESRRIVIDFIDAVFNRHEVEESTRYFAPDFVENDPWPMQPPTVEGFLAGTRDFLAGFPDARCEIDEVMEAGDRVIVRSRLVGTNTGPFMGAPPTGRRVDVKGIDIVRVAAGRLTEHWGLFDAAGMMMQLGMMPAPVG